MKGFVAAGSATADLGDVRRIGPPFMDRVSGRRTDAAFHVTVLSGGPFESAVALPQTAAPLGFPFDLADPFDVTPSVLGLIGRVLLAVASILPSPCLAAWRCLSPQPCAVTLRPSPAGGGAVLPAQQILWSRDKMFLAALQETSPASHEFPESRSCHRSSDRVE
jgi:hypothetical protein